MLVGGGGDGAGGGIEEVTGSGAVLGSTELTGSECVELEGLAGAGAGSDWGGDEGDSIGEVLEAEIGSTGETETVEVGIGLTCGKVGEEYAWGSVAATGRLGVGE